MQRSKSVSYQVIGTSPVLRYAVLDMLRPCGVRSWCPVRMRDVVCGWRVHAGGGNLVAVVLLDG
jgi:hypothetical protein